MRENPKEKDAASKMQECSPLRIKSERWALVLNQFTKYTKQKIITSYNSTKRESNKHQ